MHSPRSRPIRLSSNSRPPSRAYCEKSSSPKVPPCRSARSLPSLAMPTRTFQLLRAGTRPQRLHLNPNLPQRRPPPRRRLPYRCPHQLPLRTLRHLPLAVSGHPPLPVASPTSEESTCARSRAPARAAESPRTTCSTSSLPRCPQRLLRSPPSSRQPLWRLHP